MQKRKRMGLRKGLVLFLVIALTASMFSGCTGQTQEVQQPDEGQQQSGTPDTPQEPIKVYYLHWLTPEEVPGDELIRQKIIEEINVDPICLTPAGGSAEDKLSILLASNEPLDMFSGTWTDMAATGAIIPINDLIEEYGEELKANFAENEWEARTDKDGNVWGIPIAVMPSSSGVRIRTDWLEKVGLPFPETVEQFEEVLEAFHNEELFGKDSVPMVSTTISNFLHNAFAGLYCPSGTADFLDTDGKVKPAFFNSGYKDYIAKMAEWYSKGYFWKDGFIQPRPDIDAVVAQNRVGIMATWSSVGINGYIQLLDSGIEVEYKHMLKFTGPAGTAYTAQNPDRSCYMIPKKSQNPEAAMKLANWYNANVDNKMVAAVGLEGVHWNWVDKENQIYELLEVSEDQKVTGKYNYVQGGFHLTAWGNDNWSKAWIEAYDFALDPTLDLKIAFDRDVNYDYAKIQGVVPAYSDLEKYRDEWILKFIIGQENLSQWDQFLEQMLNIGYDKVIEEKTAQYQAAN